jgi:hypothetical protein
MGAAALFLTLGGPREESIVKTDFTEDMTRVGWVDGWRCLCQKKLLLVREEVRKVLASTFVTLGLRFVLTLPNINSRHSQELNMQLVRNHYV